MDQYLLASCLCLHLCTYIHTSLNARVHEHVHNIRIHTHIRMHTHIRIQILQEQAVAEFNDGNRIKVFLLHAGQTAAGLTLTAASDIFLMEPFLKAGEELQAMNRYGSYQVLICASVLEHQAIFA